MEQPETFCELHQPFVDADTGLKLTNFFGARSFRRKSQQSEHRVTELSKADNQLVEEAANGTSHSVIVFGSRGLTGELLSPLGALGRNRAFAAVT